MRLPVSASLARTCLALVSALAAACASAPPKAASAIHQTPPGLGQFPYSDADVEFMSGMIPHHAQAVIMAGWAPSHGARAGRRDSLRADRRRAARRDRDDAAVAAATAASTVPDATSTRHKMKMNGMEHEMLMPGMMSDEEMAALDSARGPSSIACSWKA